MKIRDPRLIALAGWCGTRLVQTLSATLRFEYQSIGRIPLDPASAPRGRRFIYALWHENFLIPITRLGNPSVSALVSSHADGQILGTLIHSTGMGVVRGSTRRGGIAAVRQLLRDDLDHRHLAVTPDGPRGPRRQVQPGVIYLASRTGMQIVPLGVGHRHPWRVPSWDAFVVPRPFSRVRCLFGEPMHIPADLGTNMLEPYRLQLQAEIEQLSRTAEDWANRGTLELSTLPPRHPIPAIQQPHRTMAATAGVRRERGE